MPEETKEQPNNSESNQEAVNQEPFAGANRPAITENNSESVLADENNQAEEEKGPNAKALEPGGIMILTIAFAFDVLGWICAILVAAFGIGAILGRIVSVLGFITIAGMQKVRGDEGTAGQALQSKLTDTLKALFKKNKGNVIAEAIPIVGDIWPGFTLMAYKGLA